MGHTHAIFDGSGCNDVVVLAPQDYSAAFQEDLCLIESLASYPDRANEPVHRAFLDHLLEEPSDRLMMADSSGTSTSASDMDAVYCKLPSLEEQQPKSMTANIMAAVAAPSLPQQAVVGELNLMMASLDDSQLTRRRQQQQLPSLGSCTSSTDQSTMSSDVQGPAAPMAAIRPCSGDVVTATSVMSPSTPMVQAAAAATAPQAAAGDAAPMAARDACPAQLAPAAGRKRKKRSRSRKNSEEMEHQRRTHIAVERNRRKQMNEHLTALRALMPPSYIQRGDQASIVGGAIQFVKELEHVLHSLQMQKNIQEHGKDNIAVGSISQFVGDLLQYPHEVSCCTPNFSHVVMDNTLYKEIEETYVELKSSTTNVEVKMVGSSAQVKVLAKKRPHLLVHSLGAINEIGLKVIHLNITTIDDTVLYSFNLEVDVECQLESPDDLAETFQHIFSIHNTL